MTAADQTLPERKLQKDADCPAVAVIILNFNAWPDTIECLESVFRSDYPNFHVFVVDNASGDGSTKRLNQWANGELRALPPHSNTREFADRGQELPDLSGRFTLLNAPDNLGFAGGNNIGLRAALEAKFDFFWILNADTVVAPDALSQLAERIQSADDIGLCGSLLCYYDQPTRIQEAGGCTYYPALGLARRLAAEHSRSQARDWRALERKMDYVSGASCMVTRDFLDTIGLMSEDYFLYCEEIDWATRAKGRFALALAEDSIVYHKKGLATGSKTHGRARSPSSSYYLWRSRRRFSQRYHTIGLIGLFALGFATSLLYVLRRDGTNAKAVLSGLTNRSSVP